MRLTTSKKEELKNQMRAWLDEHGPATKQQIANGMGLTYEVVSRLIRSKPDWLVSPGFESKRYAKIIYYHSQGEHALGECKECGVRNYHHGTRFNGLCASCAMGDDRPMIEQGFTEEQLAAVDGTEPCEHAPGTEEKILMLAARYAQGVENLWDYRDAGFEAANGVYVEAEDDDWDE